MKLRGIYERDPGSGIWWINWHDSYGRRHRQKIGALQLAIDTRKLRKSEILFQRKFPELRKRGLFPSTDAGTGKVRGVFEKIKGSGVWWVNWHDKIGHRHREKAGAKSAAIVLYFKRKTGRDLDDASIQALMRLAQSRKTKPVNRPRKSYEQRESHKLAKAVHDLIPRFREGLQVVFRCKATAPTDRLGCEGELRRAGFIQADINALISSKTAPAAVAKAVAYRKGLTQRAVQNAYSMWKKTLA